MTCNEMRDLLPAYADNELDALTSRQIEAHLRECPDCQRAYKADRAVKSALSNPALYRTAPQSLRRQFAPPPRRRILPQLLAMAAILALVIGLVWFMHNMNQNIDAQEALAMHIRSMQVDGHLMDVQSTDQHTVKPWFDGKLDFAPPVRDLASSGFPLIGGRLDYMHNRSVAALVYHRNKHVINLFIWPGESGESESTIQGYNILHWSQDGMTCWAVSDLNMADLHQFSNLFRAH